MSKLYINTDVYHATRKRLGYIFKHFDNVIVAFSGGKDSGVMLNLALQYIEDHNLPHKLGLFHIDYEAQYTATTDYVDKTYRDLGDRIENLRCCVPLRCLTCTSMHENHWRPWDPDKRDIWVRELPERHLGADAFDFLTREMSDYQFQEKLGVWHHKKTKAKKTCILIGIRADESLDRWRTIVSDRNINKYRGKPWTTKMSNNVYNAYPLYDWHVEDIWTANARFGWPYNDLYNLFYYAGVPLHAQRVASPFHDAAKSSLKLYRAIDPNVWGKMVSRVNGVNFTAIYGGTKAMGWKGIIKPEHLTWKEYMEFLLETLPLETANNYRAKLEVSKKSWVKGGGVDAETIRELEAEGAPMRRTGRTTNHGRGDKELIQFDDYVDDTTVKDFRRIPSYKRMCVCIMKNDHVCKYMGFGLTKHEMARRKAAIEKYKDI